MRRAALAVMESGERSIALFGMENEVIAEIWALYDESREEGADGAGPLSLDTVNLATDFIRALPEDVPLPELALEPDGYIEMDWMPSRGTIYSLSVHDSQRLPYAWLDGAERGHAVLFFDRATIPPRLLEDLRRVK